MYIRVKNDTAGSLSQGKVVYASGPQNANVVDVGLARADSASTMPAMGVLYQTLAAGEEGIAVVFGKAHNIAADFTVGDVLYVSPTTAGEVTNVKPTATTSHLIQNVGILMAGHASNASVFITGVGRTNDVPNNIDITGTVTTDGDITSGANYVQSQNNATETRYLLRGTASPGSGTIDLDSWVITQTANVEYTITMERSTGDLETMKVLVHSSQVSGDAVNFSVFSRLGEDTGTISVNVSSDTATLRFTPTAYTGSYSWVGSAKRLNDY
jgi:hypothetical protein